jgi:hypothetical protein
VVVVVAGREQHHVEPGAAGVCGHGEAERVAVEGKRAVEVGDSQMDVADPDGWMDGVAGHGSSLPAADATGYRDLTDPCERIA